MTETSPALKRPLRYRIEAAAAHAVFGVLSLLPPAAVSAIGGWLGRTVGPLTSAHRVAKRNLQSAIAGLDEAALKQTLISTWDNFGRTMMEYAALTRLYKSGVNVEFQGHDALSALVEQGKPAILFGGHIGNWEIAPIVLALRGQPVAIVYRAANNPLVDKIIADVRRRYTAGMAPKGSAGARHVIKALSEGRSLMMLVDQKSNTGMEIPFFGRGAFTGTTVARMAARYGCPVFPVRTERMGGLKFKITVEEPMTFSDESDEGVRAALTQINARLETWIKARPGQWLWMHKRWPN